MESRGGGVYSAMLGKVENVELYPSTFRVKSRSGAFVGEKRDLN